MCAPLEAFASRLTKGFTFVWLPLDAELVTSFANNFSASITLPLEESVSRRNAFPDNRMVPALLVSAERSSPSNKISIKLALLEPKLRLFDRIIFLLVIDAALEVCN